jgi:hypothetical protein
MHADKASASRAIGPGRQSIAMARRTLMPRNAVASLYTQIIQLFWNELSDGGLRM